MKLSPSGESAMERVHSDALHEQKEMGWIEPAASRIAVRADGPMWAPEPPTAATKCSGSASSPTEGAHRFRVKQPIRARRER